MFSKSVCFKRSIDHPNFIYSALNVYDPYSTINVLSFYCFRIFVKDILTVYGGNEIQQYFTFTKY